MNKKLIDLSHTIEHGMITYKGLPAPIICDFLSREESRQHYSAGTEFNIGKIEMVANTGTYVDSPFHRFADGIDLSELPLSRWRTLRVSLSARRIWVAQSQRKDFKESASKEKQCWFTPIGRVTGELTNTLKVTPSSQRTRRNM
jgi:kynurenine formamidase